MRVATCTGLAIAVLISACGDSGEPQQKTKSIAVRSAEQNALHKLSPDMLKVGLRRALYDSGRTCQTVTEAGYVQEFGNLSMWTASCNSGRSYAIFVGPDGSAQVRDCAEMQALKLPACAIAKPARSAS
ncbi:MAG TPA: hypothetical protein VJ775_05855 [Sphingomicrobium sp.]|nr:hypothetical protein [Sphingomicrobium sp.]